MTGVVGNWECSGHGIHWQSRSVENDILYKVKRAAGTFLIVKLLKRQPGAKRMVKL